MSIPKSEKSASGNTSDRESRPCRGCFPRGEPPGGDAPIGERVGGLAAEALHGEHPEQAEDEQGGSEERRTVDGERLPERDGLCGTAQIEQATRAAAIAGEGENQLMRRNGSMRSDRLHEQPISAAPTTTSMGAMAA